MTNETSPSGINERIIARARLANISEGDREFELELLEAYIEDAGHCLQEIETALTAAGWQQLGAVAHQLKGASGNVGAIQMMELCAQLEEEARNHCHNGTIDALYQTLEAVKRAASQW
ncbi:MAG: Hpt domain-containing protein [Synechococcus sp.]